jgi:drug/metabolite transporter (DMT)-like permease
LRERIGPRAWVAIALAVSGVALLQLARGDGAAVDVTLPGLLLLVAAVGCEGGHVDGNASEAKRRW